jgi:hypothetical protein
MKIFQLGLHFFIYALLLMVFFLDLWTEDTKYIGPFALILLYPILCMHVGYAAQTKGRNATTFFLLSFIFTPILPAIVVAIMKSEVPTNKTLVKKCPHCAEEVRLEAIKCKHCKSDIM